MCWPVLICIAFFLFYILNKLFDTRITAIRNIEKLGTISISLVSPESDGENRNGELFTYNIHTWLAVSLQEVWSPQSPPDLHDIRSLFVAPVFHYTVT